MKFREKIDELLKENMTKRGFKLWLGINTMTNSIWDRPSSSSGKYHKKSSGRVHDIAEHTYEMLYGGIKILRMFNVKKKTSRYDAIVFSIAMHDMLKYGEHGERPHTTGKHDQLIGNLIRDNHTTFSKYMTEEDMSIMEQGARYHSGMWSTDVPSRNGFDWNNYNPETLFVHILDMLSTANCLKYPGEKE